MKKLYAVVLSIVPLLLAHAGSAPDNASQDVARSSLKLDIDLPSIAHDGWNDDGQVRWVVAPRSILESTGCTRLPVPVASSLAVDSKGTIYFDGLDVERQ